MIPPRTKLHQRLVKAVQDALSSGRAERWERLLHEYPVADGFSAVLDPSVEETLFSGVQGKNLDAWLLNISSWLNSVLDPRFPRTVESSVLYCLWDRFASVLAENLRRGRVEGGIPSSGGVLAFAGGLSKCMVIHYAFSGHMARLDPVAVIDSPRSAFDVWAAIDQATPSARNILKAILASGHKLISHRGVLTHVDRRHEASVFGPSIDTLVMAEILARDLYEESFLRGPEFREEPGLALEIGSGSGFLSAGLARHLSWLTELCCVEIDFQAIACTAKNLRLANVVPELGRRPRVHLITGSFDPELLNREFNLVVCNPPYIPLPPSRANGGKAGSAHFRAVGGLELIEGLLRNLHCFLRCGGRLLLMTSSVSLEATLRLIPPGCSVTRPLGDEGSEVLFDVEAVLDSPRWLSYLTREGNLYEKSGVYFHRLHPLWIEAPSGHWGALTWRKE